MSSILNILDSLQHAMTSQQYALNVTQRNVANANDASYTKQDVVFTSGVSTDGAVTSDSGAYIQADRDQLLDSNISRETQSMAKYSAESNALQQVDSVFNQPSGSGLQDAISKFFGSFSQLSTAPDDMSLRQQVLTSAQSMSNAFQSATLGLQNIQTAQNNSVALSVNDANSLTANIADLNDKITAAKSSKSDDLFTLRDDREKLLEQLSGIMDVSYFETASGATTVTTRQGDALVLGDKNSALSTTALADGFSGISLNGNDITNAIQGGKLGGLIDVRDNKIAGYLDSLDQLASGIVSRVNEQQTDGSDLNGNAGTNLFVPIDPTSGDHAAASMALSITDPQEIAAAASGAGPGDNANAKLLAGIADEKLFSSDSESASDNYSGLVYSIGADAKAADDGVQSEQQAIEQLQNLRDSLSGVNMDEEAVNVLKYQKVYQACSECVKTINTLNDSLLAILS